MATDHRVIRAAIAWKAAHDEHFPSIPYPICECGHDRRDHSHGGGAYCERCFGTGKCGKFREKNKAERDALVARQRELFEANAATTAELNAAVAAHLKGKQA